MTSPTDLKTLSSDCSAVVKTVSGEMANVGYRPATLRLYHWVWRKFLRFTRNAPFSSALVDQFLESPGVLGSAGAGSGVSSSAPCIASAMRTLCKYAYGAPPRRGVKERCFRKPVTARTKPSQKLLSAGLETTLNRYQRYCVEHRRLGPGTLHARMRRMRRFLEFVSDRVGPRLEDLRAGHVSDFITAQPRMAPRTAAALAGQLRCFLSFLWTSEIVTKDLSRSLPKIRIPEHAHIPLVWSREQVDALLSAIDRNSARGKRDYAILLLACRLGLRSKNIRGLVLESLRWAEARIEIIQSKTGRTLTLPILDDVGDALIDYLRDGRPNSPAREVFLTMRAPFKPITDPSALSDVMKYYLHRAGIPRPEQRPVGIHSLRHTLATRMLEGNIALPTISEVLGHRTTESTLIYTKVDISALRSASLDPDAMISMGECHA